jgi:FixJ family two-component response regulator
MLTDVVMPGMNGRELADRLALIRSSVKVIYMSGYADDVITNSGVLDGDVFFIAKPFTMRDLARKLREVLAEQGAGFTP